MAKMTLKASPLVPPVTERRRFHRLIKVLTSNKHLFAYGFLF